ncbi:MAG TPA: dTDP-4-dehydrorhamnose 3,5-epimerase [Terriglobales bacterium]|jgi:dTDP-4-dehydrorhamnose 3,5-epimerase|nr:dTDP-4-dehydrorhamnose 3,5-epimerase [Terriglobales bacterium]
MRAVATSLQGVLLLEPRVFGDDRGFFLESYNHRAFAALGIGEPFVQDNHSFSEKDVVRGLHYQIRQAQGKLVRAITGEILDVALDLRRSSPTFGKWESFRLSGENKNILWIPRGFAHGFRVVSGNAHVLYKSTDFYAPEHERTVAWNDPALKIDWRLREKSEATAGASTIVSPKDQMGVPFADAEKFD